MTRRRRRYGNGNGNGAPTVWNAGTFVNLLAIFGAGAAYLIGNWYITGDELKRHETEIQEEFRNRQTDRTEFASKFDKMNEGIASLDKHAAVQDEKQDTMNETLKQILQSLNRDAMPLPHH